MDGYRPNVDTVNYETIASAFAFVRGSAIIKQVPGAKGIDRAVVWIMARRPAKQVVKLSGKKSNAKNVKFPSAGSFGYRMAA